MWEQERPVFAPAVRPLGCQTRGGLGGANFISEMSLKWGRAERESERPIVLKRPGQHNLDGGKGPHLVRLFEGGKGW